jgi:peptidoglycan L-alanyl-D-glutamate endopeptidase CwlK
MIKPNQKMSNNLQYAHPKVRAAFEVAQKELATQGITVKATQCWRSKEYQAELYAKGRTKPGKIVTGVKIGPHTTFPSIAVDFAIFSKDGKKVYWDLKIDLDKDKHPDWYEAVAVFRKHGLFCGADWERFKDVPHLEMTFGKTYTQLNAMTPEQILALK